MGTNLQKVELVTLIQDAFSCIQNVLQMVTETLPLGDEKVYVLFDENDPKWKRTRIYNQNRMLFMVTLLFPQEKSSL
jgi:hypothetical protein